MERHAHDAKERKKLLEIEIQQEIINVKFKRISVTIPKNPPPVKSTHAWNLKIQSRLAKLETEALIEETIKETRQEEDERKRIIALNLRSKLNEKAKPPGKDRAANSRRIQESNTN